jgi:hypothetical protein
MREGETGQRKKRKKKTDGTEGKFESGDDGAVKL